MKTKSEIKADLKAWISRTHGNVTQQAIGDDTPIFRDGLLKSVQVPELILYIEELAQRPVDIEKIQPGAFRDVQSILHNFFGNDHA